MEILNILQCTNLGGMEQSSLRLMKALSPSASFLVVSVHPFGPMKPVLDDAGIASFDCEYNGILGLKSHIALRRMLKKVGLNRPIMMTGPTITGLLALPVKRAHRRVLMVHFHHKGVHPEWAWKILYKLAMQRFDHVTFPSDFVRDEAIALCPAIEKMSTTVRNVVDLPVLPAEEERDAARLELGIPEGNFVVSNAGWLIHRKRFDVFVRVAAEVAKSRQDVTFLIAGDGELRGELEHLVQELGIAHVVRFSGWIKDMRKFYCATDVLLFNTDWDAYPTTPIEAMSYGIPVVASAVHSGIGEIVTNTSGILRNDHDHVAMGADVIRLLDNREEYKEMAAAARLRVEEMSSPELTWKPVANLFECRL